MQLRGLAGLHHHAGQRAPQDVLGQAREPKLKPKTQVNVAASLYFLVAAALIDGAVTLETIAPAAFGRADILAPAQKVEPHADPALGAGFDGRLAVTTTDGRMLTQEPPAGDPTPAKVRAKFAAIAGLAAAAIEAAMAHGPAAAMRAAQA